MATSLSDGYIYFLDWYESDGDNVDLDDGTVGTNYCYLKLPKFKSERNLGEVDYNHYPSNLGHFNKKGTAIQPLIYHGYLTSRTELGYVKTFKAKRHQINEITEPEYLYVRYAANDYYPFSSPSGNLRDYARGAFEGYNLIESDDKEFLYKAELFFMVVWDT